MNWSTLRYVMARVKVYRLRATTTRDDSYDKRAGLGLGRRLSTPLLPNIVFPTLSNHLNHLSGVCNVGSAW